MFLTEPVLTKRIPTWPWGDPADRHVVSGEEYVRTGGYESLRKALSMDPSDVIAQVKASQLRGRGGAGFPCGVKWGFLPEPDGGRRYLAVNCDEAEPGTFKDRLLVDYDPHLVLEGIAIACWACQLDTAYFFIRGEYRHQAHVVQNAIKEAYDLGVFGPQGLLKGTKTFAVDCYLHRGAGAYICGEETALFNSIEGFRGEPRNKPPFPTTHGLFGQPTAINNVETLVNVLPIMVDGGEAYRATGTERSPGTRLFCLSGRVANPGIYEHEFGITLRGVLEAAGGVIGADEPHAVLLGGAAGFFVRSGQLDLPLTLEDTRAAGVSLGSGVVMVFGEEDDMVDTVRRVAEFFRDESCGQCVPCRVGTIRQEEVLARLRDGATLDAERDLLDDLAAVMGDASICGLGQMASGAVRSALDLGLLEGSR